MFVNDHHLSRLNLSWLIAQHLSERAMTVGGTRICSGHMVTRIARSLGLFNEEQMESFCGPVMCKPVEMKNFGYLREAGIGKLRELPEVLEIEPVNIW